MIPRNSSARRLFVSRCRHCAAFRLPYRLRRHRAMLPRRNDSGGMSQSCVLPPLIFAVRRGRGGGLRSMRGFWQRPAVVPAAGLPRWFQQHGEHSPKLWFGQNDVRCNGDGYRIRSARFRQLHGWPTGMRQVIVRFYRAWFCFQAVWLCRLWLSGCLKAWVWRQDAMFNL